MLSSLVSAHAQLDVERLAEGRGHRDDEGKSVGSDNIGQNERRISEFSDEYESRCE